MIIGKTKEKVCKVCTKKFPPFQTTQQVCGVICSLAHARQKHAKKMKQQHAIEKKVFNDNDLNKQLRLTQKAFNHLRRLQELAWFKARGLEPECISCGKQNMDWCCGHFKTVGAQGALRFDEMNTYLQCNRYCNMGLSGNISGNKNTRGYKVGLAERFGPKMARKILRYCSSKTAARKWTCDELRVMRKSFNEGIRDLR